MASGGELERRHRHRAEVEIDEAIGTEGIQDPQFAPSLDALARSPRSLAELASLTGHEIGSVIDQELREIRPASPGKGPP